MTRTVGLGGHTRFFLHRPSLFAILYVGDRRIQETRGRWVYRRGHVLIETAWRVLDALNNTVIE